MKILDWFLSRRDLVRLAQTHAETASVQDKALAVANSTIDDLRQSLAAVTARLDQNTSTLREQSKLTERAIEAADTWKGAAEQGSATIRAIAGHVTRALDDTHAMSYSGAVRAIKIELERHAREST